MGIEHLPIVGGLVSFVLMLMVMAAFVVGVVVIIWVVKRKGKVAEGINLSDGIDANEWKLIQKLWTDKLAQEAEDATKARMREVAGKETKAA